jgi:hypothetical protein
MRSETKLVFKCPICGYDKFVIDDKYSGRKYRCGNPAPGGSTNHICGTAFDEDQMYKYVTSVTVTTFETEHELDLYYKARL